MAALLLCVAVPGVASDEYRPADSGERARRLALDFPHDDAALRRQLDARLAGVTADDVERWAASGALGWTVIDGQRRWFHRAVGNLLLLAPDAAARVRTPSRTDDGPLYALHPMHARWRAMAVEAAGADAERRVIAVDPQVFEVTHTVTVDADAVPSGEALRVWIPFPRAIAGVQDQVDVVATTPAGARLASEVVLQRSAYFETTAVAGRATVVSITYRVRTYTRVAHLDAGVGLALSVAEHSDLAEYLAERPPHVVFHPELRAFSARSIGDATAPVDVARRLFDAVSAKPWAVAREYSTVDNLSLHALRQPHADCGEKAMLLITLLRINGIPARWQSGWQLSPGTFDTMHDWLQAYLPPWGWVPLDPTHGPLASDDPALRHFYFGGLDGFRIAFNDDWGRAFDPAKTHPRSEPVDAQRGEVEWRGGNLYFDVWDYDVQWRRLSAR
ncbi:transglutaminase domain-containing protein [Silanimonas sp.]|uniref:transglutaminase-like domain-containing protein n=1 Tax=Silanimonas sp. TaxID=1929290 RepID=UPI0022BC7FD9|nr:transglutaminase domain-containing protein [Silanimonas sp.]MCZ8165724.1 transglutaminase domain-containing protein [Silanimonas sp.]